MVVYLILAKGKSYLIMLERGEAILIGGNPCKITICVSGTEKNKTKNEREQKRTKGHSMFRSI